MSRSRALSAALLKSFAAAAEPAYVINAEREIVYANDALEAWLSISADDLYRQACRYQAVHELTGPAAAAAALSPPEEAFAGEMLTGTIVWSPGGAASESRRARYLRLADADGSLAHLVVVVDRHALDAAAAAADAVSVGSSPLAEAQKLHERLRRFQTLVAGRFHFGRLAGESPAIERVRRQVELAASDPETRIWIEAPRGGQASDVAKAIHYFHDGLAAGSFVPLDAEILTSELLAVTLHPLLPSSGRPAPKSGTLFVAAIERLALDAQRLLLAIAIAKQTGAAPRIIVASTTPLETLVAAERVLPELAALVSTIEIRIPPLAARREDIPLLAQVLVEERNQPQSPQKSGFSPEAMDKLVNYPWPRDADELAEVVGQAIAASRGSLLTLADLPRLLDHAHEAAVYPRKVVEPIVLEEVLASVEIELIQKALAKAKGNKSKAAHLLGLTRPKLYRRLVQLGLEVEASEAGEDPVFE